MTILVDSQKQEALSLAKNQEVDNENLLLAQKLAAKSGDWEFVYELSRTAGLETSVLIDSSGKMQIDWGSPGLVPVRPFYGAEAPFVLWVHTHPSMGAYWSMTDRQSLAYSTSILKEAMVLGEPGVKVSRNSLYFEIQDKKMLSNSPSLCNWTEEEVIPWS